MKMTRNLKALGLALMAAFAMSVVAASSASASQHNFFGQNNPTIIKGTSESDQILHRGSSEINCGHAEYEGEAIADTTVTGGFETDTIEILADYTTVECEGPLNSEVHVDFTTGECGFHFTATASKTAVAGVFCDGNHPITVTPTAFGSSLCTISVPVQTTAGHVTFTNIANGDVTVNATTVSGIDSTRTGSSLCGPATDTAGLYTGDVIIEGVNSNIEVT
jgi:hypothetical protein